MQAQNLDQRKRIADQEASRRRLQVSACVIATSQLVSYTEQARRYFLSTDRLTKKLQRAIFMKHVHDDRVQKCDNVIPTESKFRIT